MKKMCISAVTAYEESGKLFFQTLVQILVKKRLHTREQSGVWQLQGFIISDFTPPTACPSGWLVSLG